MRIRVDADDDAAGLDNLLLARIWDKAKDLVLGLLVHVLTAVLGAVHAKIRVVDIFRGRPFGRAMTGLALHVLGDAIRYERTGKEGNRCPLVVARDDLGDGFAEELIA